MLGRVFEGWGDKESGEIAPPHRRKRRKAPVILLVLLLIVLGLAASAFTYYRWCQGSSSGPQLAITIDVPRGATGNDVVSLLHQRGVVRCSGIVSKLVLRSRNQTFEAGTYHLTTNMSLDDALDILDRGPSAPPSIRLTIPEGYRLTQIATRVEDDLHVSAHDFLALAQSGQLSLAPYLPPGKPSVEGFLFPNTYRFPEHDNTADAVITKLLGEFRTEAQGLPWQNAGSLGVDDYGIVTIASMIEREARVPQDRSRIAAVIYNRLKIGMPLGIDATLLYADPTPGDNSLSASDLESNSPYNTRKHTGLPPTPIASPGLASLRAALDPAPVDYLYYVLCGADGHHVFTRSYSEFLRLKSQCLG